MRPLNKLDDVEKYKHYGNLTQPFLSKKYINDKIMLDLDHKHKSKDSEYFLLSLFLWIHHNVKYSHEQDIQNLKFMRSAQEIWESKKASGCTDFAILFATFARTLGIPTSILYTASVEWLEKLKNGDESTMHIGHTFCECYFNSEWILVDPTSKRIEKSYNPEKIKLSYHVVGENVFVPYYRGLDLGKKLNTKEHNKMMDNLCSEIKI